MKNPQLTYSVTKDFLKVRNETRMPTITNFITYCIESSSQSNKAIDFQLQIGKK